MIQGYPFGRLKETVVASTTSVAFKGDLIRLTGTTSIATIAAPTNNSPTVVFVVPVDGTVATTTAGNISKAVSMVINQVTVIVYSKVLAKWVPGAIS